MFFSPALWLSRARTQWVGPTPKLRSRSELGSPSGRARWGRWATFAHLNFFMCVNEQGNQDTAHPPPPPKLGGGGFSGDFTQGVARGLALPWAIIGRPYGAFYCRATRGGQAGLGSKLGRPIYGKGGFLPDRNRLLPVKHRFLPDRDGFLPLSRRLLPLMDRFFPGIPASSRLFPDKFFFER